MSAFAASFGSSSVVSILVVAESFQHFLSSHVSSHFGIVNGMLASVVISSTEFFYIFFWKKDNRIKKN